MRTTRQPAHRPHPAFQTPAASALRAVAAQPGAHRPLPVGRLRYRRSLTPLGTRATVAVALAAAVTGVAGSTAVAALNVRPAVSTHTLAIATGTGPHLAPAGSTGSTGSTVLAPVRVQRSSPATNTGAVTPPAPVSSTPTGLKAPVVGLVDRHHAPPASYAPAVRSFVVDTTWASVQPVQGGPIVHPNAIDTAIAYARANDMALKLRVAAGIDAPAWAKTLDGPPMTFSYTAATVRSAGTVAGTVGRFWTPKFSAAYADLQAKLAAAYDAVPQVRETTVTQCGTIFNETYLRNTKDPQNAATLLAAGFTVAKDNECHAAQIQAHKVWTHTMSEVAFNPYQAIQPDGSTKQDLAYTLSQMDYCRQVLGANCMLANFSLSSSRITDSQYSQMYQHMIALGGGMNFQTATAAKIGSYTTVLAWAASVGANSVELPTGYTTWPITTLTSYASKMAS